MWEACFHIQMFEKKILMMQATEWENCQSPPREEAGSGEKVRNMENPSLVMGETYLLKCIHSFIIHLFHMLFCNCANRHLFKKKKKKEESHRIATLKYSIIF